MAGEGILGFETLVVSATAVPLVNTGGTIHVYALSALLTVETAPLRWRCDGTAPTAAVGHLATDGDSINLPNRFAVRNFRAIRQGGVDATIRATFMG